MSCFTRGRPLRQPPPPPPPGWPPGSRETVKAVTQGMPAGGQRPSVGLGGAQRPSLAAAHPPNRGLEALPRMSYAATRGGCSGGAVGGGAGDCRSGSSSAAAVRPALRTGREAPGPSVGSSGYRLEEAAAGRSSGYGEARSSGYGRGPAPPPRDLRPPPRGEAGSGLPRHYEHPATIAAARAQQLERGGSSTELRGPSTPAFGSGALAAERGSCSSANALPPARRGEERRGEEPPPGRGEPAKCDAAPPRRRLQPHRVLGAATPCATGCTPTWWRLQPCYVCWRPLPSLCPRLLPPHVPRCDKCDGPHETAACPWFRKARDRHPDAAPARDKRQLGGTGPVEILRSARVVCRTHARHARHARTSAQAHKRTNARTHASPPGRAAPPARHSAPSFCPSFRPSFRPSSCPSSCPSAGAAAGRRLLPLPRARLRTARWLDGACAATAGGRVHTRHLTPTQTPPDPDPDSAPELNPDPNPTCTPESIDRWPVLSSPTRPSPSPIRRSKTGRAATIGSRGCNQMS